MGFIAPQWLFQVLDNVGNVAMGAKLFSYVAGTSIPTPLYSDQACTSPLANPFIMDAAGRGEFWLKETISYRLRVEDAEGNVLEDRSPIVGGIGAMGGDTFKVKADADDTAPGFLDEKLADTTDTQFSPTEDGSQLDNIVYQLTGLGARLNRVKDAGFDFDVGPFPQASYAGGRGICFGRRFVAGVEVDTWVAQANNGKLYWTSNNDASRWKVVTEDLSVYTTFPNDRTHYGWSCIQFVYVAGTHNCFCWVMGSGDHERHVTFVEHKAENYNADGTFKASALDGVTYPVGTGPYTPIDIMQVDTSGGIFIAGDDPKVGFTTDLANFQLAVTADHNVGGLGFDGEDTVQVIERDYGVIWRSTNLGNPGTFSKVATFYLDDVPVSNFPMPQPGGTAAQWGSMFSMYGQWLSINFHYVAGGIGFIYSDDGIYWYSSRDEATPFYDANNDGLRWFATNAVPNSGSPIFQLIVSMIPAHRRMSLEKGGVVSGPLILRELPNVPILGTDHRGRIVSGTADLSELSDVAISSPTTGQVIKYDGVKWVNGNVSGGSSYENLGVNWSPRGIPPVGARPWTFVISDPIHGTVVAFILGESFVDVSMNGFDSYKRVSLPIASNIVAGYFCPQDNSIIGLTPYGGWVKSLDGGYTWTTGSTGFTNIPRSAIFSGIHNAAFAYNSVAFAKSINGTTFSQILSASSPAAIIVNESTGRIGAFFTSSGNTYVQYSDDGGTTWSTSTTAFSGSAVSGIWSHLANAAIIFTNDKFWRTIDFVSFVEVNCPISGNWWYSCEADTGEIFVIDYSNVYLNVAVSRDGGASFALSPSFAFGPTASAVYPNGIAFDTKTKRLIVANGYAGAKFGVFVSPPPAHAVVVTLDP